MTTFISTLRFSFRNIRSIRSVVNRPFHSGCTVYRIEPSLSAGSTSSNDSAIEDSLFNYSVKHSTPLPEKFEKLHESTSKHFPETWAMTISPLQGQFMTLLMRMTRPRLVLELGCFMGYSAMAMADGLPKGSTIYTCESNPKAAGLARELFTREGYDGSNQTGVKIKLLEGKGMDSLQTLAKEKLQFDAVFLDADKGGYIGYHDFILNNNMLSDHGYFVADNVLFSGLVLHANKKSYPKSVSTQYGTFFTKSASQVDKYNNYVKNDPRVTVAVLPVFDGLSIVMKK
ncbi:hypothetical protein BGZ76_007387 [Entomortierella beljakovae]|nr:hypothetical protein BGZ76_007387 [Entomortierella beljakovae]